MSYNKVSGEEKKIQDKLAGLTDQLKAKRNKTIRTPAASSILSGIMQMTAIFPAAAQIRERPPHTARRYDRWRYRG